MDRVVVQDQMFDIFEMERLNIARSLTQDMVNTLLGLEENFLQFLTGLFEQGLQDGDFKRLSARRMAELLRGMTHFSIHSVIRSPKTHNLKEDAVSIKDVFFKGVLNK